MEPESPDPADYRLSYEPSHKSVEKHVENRPEHFASEILKNRMARYTLKAAIEKCGVHLAEERAAHVGHVARKK